MKKRVTMLLVIAALPLSGMALAADVTVQMIHARGDNHADQPSPCGGGGAGLVCGVIS